MESMSLAGAARRAMWVRRWGVVGALTVLSAACTGGNKPQTATATTAVAPSANSQATGGSAVGSVAPSGADDPVLDTCDDLGIMPCPRQVARLAVPIPGTAIALTYSSDRVPGRVADPSPDVRGVGLAGWTLSVLDSLDPTTKTLVTGAGEDRRVNPVGVTAGSGTSAVASRDGRRIDVFDARGRAVAVYDASTGSSLLTFGWDDHGLKSVSDTSGIALTVTRDASGVPVRLDSTRGPQTALGVRDGGLAAIRYPDGTVARFASSPEGQLTAWADPAGVVTRFSYDPAGRLQSRTSGTAATTIYQRASEVGKLTVTTTAPSGAAVIDVVEKMPGGALRRSHTDAAGQQTAVTAEGDTRKVTSPGGRTAVVQLAADPRWGMDAPVTKSLTVTTDTAGAGATASATVSEQRVAGAVGLDGGQPHESAISVDGSTWHFAYDPTTRTSTTTDPSARTTTAVLDDAGRVVKRVVAGALSVGYTYDDSGRIASITLGQGSDARTWQYSYGPASVEVTDPVGARQKQVVDLVDHVAEIQGPGDFGLQVTSDGAGRTTSFTGADGGQYRVTRQADGRIAATTSPDGIGGPQFVTVDYDAAGNPVKLNWSDGSETIQRDQTGRLDSFDAGAGAWVAGYDDAGRLISIGGPGAGVTDTYAGGAVVAEQVKGPFDVTVARTVDKQGRTASETVGGGAEVRYEYDAGGLLIHAGDLTITRDPSTGYITAEHLGNITRQWQRNQFGEATSETVMAGTATVASIQWQRDGIGRVVTQTAQNGSSAASVDQYTYDTTVGSRRGSTTALRPRTNTTRPAISPASRRPTAPSRRHSTTAAMRWSDGQEPPTATTARAAWPRRSAPMAPRPTTTTAQVRCSRCSNPDNRRSRTRSTARAGGSRPARTASSPRGSCIAIRCALPQRWIPRVRSRLGTCTRAPRRRLTSPRPARSTSKSSTLSAARCSW